jgi:hypothetical protein
MPDGVLTLEIDAVLAERLRAAARDAGVGVEAYAANLLESAIEDPWVEEEGSWREYLQTGESVSLEEAMADLRAGLARRFADKR